MAPTAAHEYGWVRPASGDSPNRGRTLLWTIVLILVVLWALGLITAIGEAFIHLLLIVALVVIAAQLLTSRRAA